MVKKIFKLEDIFSLAVKIEEQGRKFYEAASTHVQPDGIKELFLRLSKAEIEHAKIFGKFYKNYSKKRITFVADEQFEGLFDVLFRGTLFPDISEVRDKLMARNRKEILPIIKIAMDVETNTILFYQEMLDILKSRQTKAALFKVIKEEKSHLVMLRNLRMDLDPYYAGLAYGKFF